MLGTAKQGPALAGLDHALGVLGDLFAEAGNEAISVPHLYHGETLLDLYGEDLRARAFLFPDAERGEELCLRPDFTVPIALAHRETGWDLPGAYAYQGRVFRRQPTDAARPVEYHQAGVERFGDSDRISADAATFALMHRGLTALGVATPRATIGDLGIAFALLDVLDMPDARRAHLRRHLWRPARFADLIRRAQAPDAPSPLRQRLLAVAGDGDAIEALCRDAGEPLGLRTTTDIAGRAQALARAAGDPAMPAADARLIEAVLAVRGPAHTAGAALGALTAALAPALDHFEARLAAIADHGIDLSGLSFDAAFGRNLEYYDGFVFELRAPTQGEHPPLAGGGRYDAMTTRLGAARPVPAIGAIIRPEAVLEATR